MNENKVRNLLIISDNYDLLSFLIKEIKSNDINNFIHIKLSYSSKNKQPEKLIQIGASEINLASAEVVNEIIEEFDMVFSLHCKQIFPKDLVEKLTCINFHPGFNPYNRGWYPQVFSILNGLPIGATIHLMDSEIDSGDIIDQAEVNILPSDTSLEVYNKTIIIEKELIRKNIFNILHFEFKTFKPKTLGNYNGISDFKTLCEINLESVDTFANHLKMLRALSHGEFKNAYFFDTNGNKIFVRLTIESALA
jgi:methionyl-tRNA formyltransferase